MWNLLQIIKGSDSPLARAAAAGKPTAHLRAAAAADLDTLQQLAVAEKTLAGWVSAWPGPSCGWPGRLACVASAAEQGLGWLGDAVPGALALARARGWQRRAAPDPPTMLCNEPGSQTGKGRQSATRASKAQQRHWCRPFRVLPSPLQVKDTVYGLTDQWLGAASSLALPQGSQPAPEAVHEALLAAEAPLPALLAPLSEAQRAGLRAELAGKWRWSEGIEVGAECRLLLNAGAIRRPALQRHSCASAVPAFPLAGMRLNHGLAGPLAHCFCHHRPC